MYRVAEVRVDHGEQIKCCSPPDLAIRVGDQCVIWSPGNVLEFGQLERLDDNVGEMPQDKTGPQVLRRATLQDQSKADENALMSRMAVEKCSAMAEKDKLEIGLVRMRYSFDRTVLSILYSAEDRVDIREMAKSLGKELRTRVDMRQIGVRDEAGIIGGVGSCGRQLCCCSWRTRFESINVRMAKAQGLSLNPSAIGGNCGRLKCCLNYEFAHYKQMSKNLPRQGGSVQTPGGMGIVIETCILTQRVKVRLQDERILSYDAAEVGDSGRQERETEGSKR